MSPATNTKAAALRCPECGAAPSEPCVTTVGYAGVGVTGIPLLVNMYHVARLQGK